MQIPTYDSRASKKIRFRHRLRMLSLKEVYRSSGPHTCLLRKLLRSRKLGALSMATQLVGGQVPGARTPTSFLYSFFSLNIREGIVLKMASCGSSKHRSWILKELIRIPVLLPTSCVSMASYLTSLGLRFLIYKVGDSYNTYQPGFIVRVNWDDAQKIQSIRPGPVCINHI